MDSRVLGLTHVCASEYNLVMTLNELENAISGLSGEDLVRFRAWFAEYDSAGWDQQLEQDVAAGKLDAMADNAIREHQVGKTSPL
jgi:hypothetical protein